MTLTRDDVARLAGVSTATVSYVLNDGPRPVMDETRAKVLQAVEQLGYKPNLLARRMARKKTLAVALVVPEIANPFFAELSRHVSNAAFEAGYTLILCSSNDDAERERLHLTLLNEKRIDGILLITAGHSPHALRSVLDRQIPIVLLDRQGGRDPVDTVLTDNAAIGRCAADHLVAHGYTTFACIAGPQTLPEAQQRVAGFRQVLDANRITLEAGMLRWQDWTLEGGYEGLHSLFDAGHQPRAIFASNDQMAVGALHAAQERGLRVPEDLAMVSVDNTLSSTMAVPPLTAVAQPIAALGRRGMALLLERVRGTASPTPVQEVLAPHLVVRRSCGCTPTSPTLHWASFAPNRHRSWAAGVVGADQ